jgi:hypothetical protein
MNLRAMLLQGSAGRICHLENVKSYFSYLQQCTKIIKIKVCFCPQKRMSPPDHNVTISLKKFFITNPLILEEQNSFKIIGT